MLLEPAINPDQLDYYEADYKRVYWMRWALTAPTLILVALCLALILAYGHIFTVALFTVLAAFGGTWKLIPRPIMNLEGIQTYRQEWVQFEEGLIIRQGEDGYYDGFTVIDGEGFIPVTTSPTSQGEPLQVS